MQAVRPWLLWAGSRAAVLLLGLQVLPIASAQYLFSDVRLYDYWAEQIVAGTFPTDESWQYPPLVAPLFVLARSIAGNTLGFVTLALIADGILLLLLHRQADKTGSTTGVWLWAGAAVLLGPLLLGRMDVFPTLLAVAATLVSGWPAGVLLGAGAMLKIWPVLLLGRFRRKDLPKPLLGFLGAVFILAAALLTRWPGAFNFLHAQEARGLQVESVAALPWVWQNAGPGTVELSYQYGAIQVVAPHTQLATLIATYIWAMLLLALVALRLFGQLENHSGVVLGLTAVLISIVMSRVYSPQYNIWLVGLLAVALGSGTMVPRGITWGIIIATVCGNVGYPWLYVQFMAGSVPAVLLHSIRVIALLVATVSGLAYASRPARRS